MQNQSVPPEGRSSELTRGVAGSPGTACCASSLLDVKTFMRKIFDGFPLRLVEAGSCHKFGAGDPVAGCDALKKDIKGNVAEVPAARAEHGGKHLDPIIVQLLIPLLELLHGSGGRRQPTEEELNGIYRDAPLLECRLNQMGLLELVDHDSLHNVIGMARRCKARI
jgi:hypothetical protein